MEPRELQKKIVEMIGEIDALTNGIGKEAFDAKVMMCSMMHTIACHWATRLAQSSTGRTKPMTAIEILGAYPIFYMMDGDEIEYGVTVAPENVRVEFEPSVPSRSAYFVDIEEFAARCAERGTTGPHMVACEDGKKDEGDE